MREGDDPALLPEPEEAPEPEEVPESCDTETVWTALRRVLGEILNHDNARLTAECIALVSGLSYSGASMAEIARRHGITRAAVSKRCVELTELLDLRPSRAMRSLTARKSYRAARIRSLQEP
jgi:DNA-directed RNA polymerase specialized sigma24 family protein